MLGIKKRTLANIPRRDNSLCLCVKPYECKVCGKMLTGLSNRNKHLKEMFLYRISKINTHLQKVLVWSITVVHVHNDPVQRNKKILYLLLLNKLSIGTSSHMICIGISNFNTIVEHGRDSLVFRVRIR